MEILTAQLIHVYVFLITSQYSYDWEDTNRRLLVSVAVGVGFASSGQINSASSFPSQLKQYNQTLLDQSFHTLLSEADH